MCRGKTCVYCAVINKRPIDADVLVGIPAALDVSPDVAAALDTIVRLLTKAS